MANDSSSNIAERSWYEICDEELSSINENHNKHLEENKAEINILPDYLDKSTSLTSELEKNDSSNNLTPGKIVKTEPHDDEQDEGLKTEESPWRLSYASVLKNSANKDNISVSSITPSKQVLPKRELTEPDDNPSPIKSAKRELQRDFLQEDLSLSSHLDVFHMQSPMKSDSQDSEKNTDRELRWKKRACNPKVSLNEDDLLSDEVLMPSPTKVTRLSSRRKREPGESPLACKRPKPGTPQRTSMRKGLEMHSPKELETDQQVLTRRQKQIDYGKNTIGYERYCQLVPKDKRHRKHPHTPPKNAKYSRRAWDGLIRQWRQQLHFWDPPSERGGNLEDLDLSSMSETSSDTRSLASSSLPPTPTDKRKSLRSSTRTTRSSASESSSFAEDTGCLPLDDEK